MRSMEHGCSTGRLIRITLFLQTFIAQKKDQQRFIYCEKRKWSGKPGHSTSLQPIKNLILLYRVMGRRFFEEVCVRNLDNQFSLLDVLALR